LFHILNKCQVSNVVDLKEGVLVSQPEKGYDQEHTLSESILKLHEVLVTTTKLEDFPERIREPIREVMPFDKLCVFGTCSQDSFPSLINRHTSTLQWDAIYPGITIEDQHSSIVYRGQPGDIFLSQDMKGPGCKGDEHALELIRLHSGARFSIHLILSITRDYRLWLTLFRIRKPFTHNEAETLGQFAPALCMSAKAHLSARLASSGNLLLSASEEKAIFHYMLLDRNFKVIGLPEPTRDFLAVHFNDPLIHAMPASLRAWIEDCGLMDHRCDKKGVSQTAFVSSAARIECKAYMLEDSYGKEMVLISLNLSRHSCDFKPLFALGLTQREISVLNELYTGKSNVKIGESLGIRSITVRKHLINIGSKLHAFSRTEILAKALEASNDIPAGPHHPDAPPATLFGNRMQPYSKHSDNLSEAVIELHRRLPTLDDFDEVPELLKSILARHMNFDWAAVYCLSTSNDIEKICVNPGLKCDWERLFTAIRKSIRWVPVVREGALGEVSLSQDLMDPTNEHDLYMKTIVQESTGAVFSLQMLVAKTREHRIYLGLHRNDPDRPYTSEDVAFMEKISPLIISWAQSLVCLRENTFHEMGSRSLLEKEQVRAVLFDMHLCDVMWTDDALKMIESHAGPSWRDLLLPKIQEWVRQAGLLKNGRKKADRPCPEHLVLDSFNLDCCAYLLESYILVNFKKHETDPFLILKKCGLTKREIQVLAYLPLGYSNRQIASALGISEVTVKKHMERIGQRLDVSGRTAIMRQAEVLKRSLKN
jgi:DNA-binding NarL/FixJ family response regulator